MVAPLSRGTDFSPVMSPGGDRPPDGLVSMLSLVGTAHHGEKTKGLLCIAGKDYLMADGNVVMLRLNG